MPSVHSTFQARAVAVTAVGFALLVPAVARAEAAESSAESLFQKAQERMAQHDLTAACDLFARSMKADAALGTLLNLAACHEKQGKTATAFTEFTRAKALAAQSGDGQRAEFARLHLVALEGGLHRIVIEIMTPAPSMRVALDGADLPREAWGTALPLDPGEHRIDVVAEGRAPFARDINLGPSSGTNRIEVTLKLAAVAPTPSQGPPSPDGLPPAASMKGDGRAWQRPAGFGVGGLGVVGVGVAVVFGAQMANQASQRDKLCPPSVPCLDQAAFSADHAARLDRQWMFVSGGLGVAALGAGAALVIAPRGKASPVSSLQVTPVTASGSAGVGVRGAF